MNKHAAGGCRITRDALSWAEHSLELAYPVAEGRVSGRGAVRAGSEYTVTGLAKPDSSPPGLTRWFHAESERPERPHGLPGRARQ
jgi:hypothetical protein